MTENPLPLATLTGNSADDTEAVSAGTGQKLAVDAAGSAAALIAAEKGASGGLASLTGLTLTPSQVPVSVGTGSSPSPVWTIEQWILGQAFTIAAGVPNANGVLTSANLTWPDGATGVYTVNTLDATGGVDNATFTYVWGGGSHGFTLAITRSPSTGAATASTLTQVS